MIVSSTPASVVPPVSKSGYDRTTHLFDLKRPGFLRSDHKVWAGAPQGDKAGYGSLQDAVKAAGELTQDKNSAAIAVLLEGVKYALRTTVTHEMVGGSAWEIGRGTTYDAGYGISKLQLRDSFVNANDALQALVQGDDVITRERIELAAS